MANPPLPDFDFNFDFDAIESLDAEQAGPEADSDESPSLEDQLARAIADFATAEPLDAPPVNPRTPGKRAAARTATPTQLLPAILVELGLADYDIIRLNEQDTTERFLGMFLSAVKDDFTEFGCGIYGCILQARHPNLDIDMLKRFHGAARTTLTRARKHSPGPEFRFVFQRYEILPDKRHAVASFARMTVPVFNSWMAKRRAAAAQASGSLSSRVKGLL